MTPGQRRAHAHFLRNEAADYRRMAASPDALPSSRKRWLDVADRMEDDANWYDASASRGEITVEYSDITRFAEAAE